jgi:opacity protein-like surface antigen
MIRRLLCLAVLLTAGLRPVPAAAQWVFIQPFAGLTFGGDTNIVDLEDATKLRKAAWGATVTVIGRGSFGAEADFGFVPDFFQREEDSQIVTGSQVVTLMGNAVFAAPLSWIGESLRPYVSGGLGLMRTRVEDVFDIFSTDRNLLGVNLGGGAIGFFTERVGVRVDVRYFHSVADLDERDPISIGDAELSFWRGNVALVLKY